MVSGPRCVRSLQRLARGPRRRLAGRRSFIESSSTSSPTEQSRMRPSSQGTRHPTALQSRSVGPSFGVEGLGSVGRADLHAMVLQELSESPHLPSSFGITVLDAATGAFSLSTFDDDVCRTKLETMFRQLRPKEIVHEKVSLESLTCRRTLLLCAHIAFWDLARSVQPFCADASSPAGDPAVVLRVGADQVVWLPARNARRTRRVLPVAGRRDRRRRRGSSKVPGCDPVGHGPTTRALLPRGSHLVSPPPHPPQAVA